MGKQPSAKSPLHKWIFSNNDSKKADIKVFWSCPIFLISFFFFCQIVCSKSQKKEKQSSLPSKCWKSENAGNLAIGISRKRWSKVIRRQLEERKVRKELAKDCYTWMLTNKNSCNSYMYGKQVLNLTRWQCIILLTFIIRINLISSLNYHCSAEVLLKRVFCLEKKRYNSF